MTLTAEQKRVFEWLKEDLDLHMLADAYAGACLLLEAKTPGYVTFVAHAGRDLMNRLPTEVAGIKSGRVQYKDLVDELQKEWREEWEGQGLDDGAEEGRMIPYSVCAKVKTLISEHRSGTERSGQNGALFYTTFLGYDDPKTVPANFAREWKAAHKEFHRNAHLRGGSFSEDEADGIERFFQYLDRLLNGAASSEFERLGGVRAILDEANR